MFNPKRDQHGNFAKGWTCAGNDPRKHFLNTYKGIHDKWVPENQGKHLCQCGCNGIIIIQPHHFRAGIPRFISGHYARTEAYKAAVRQRNRTRSGEKHWNWQGGITPTEESIRKSIEYANWRTQVFKRDRFVCQGCGIRSGSGKAVYLHAHHKIPFSVIVKAHKSDPEILARHLFDPENGLTLCRSCHDAIPKPPRGPLRKNQSRGSY